MIMTLDVNSPVPLHVQLKEALKRIIQRGEYTERIPSERELIETFAVSRTTVREAVGALVREGVVQKIHGKGTFVTSHTVNEWLGSLRSFTETIESMGMKPGIRLLRHGIQEESSDSQDFGNWQVLCRREAAVCRRQSGCPGKDPLPGRNRLEAGQI